MNDYKLNENNTNLKTPKEMLRMDSVWHNVIVQVHVAILLALACIPAAAVASNSSLLTLLQVSSVNYDNNGSTEAVKQSVQWVNSNQALLPYCTQQVAQIEDHEVCSAYQQL